MAKDLWIFVIVPVVALATTFLFELARVLSNPERRRRNRERFQRVRRGELKGPMREVFLEDSEGDLERAEQLERAKKEHRERQPAEV